MSGLGWARVPRLGRVRSVPAVNISVASLWGAPPPPGVVSPGPTHTCNKSEHTVKQPRSIDSHL